MKYIYSIFYSIAFAAILSSCAAVKNYRPDKKIPADLLQKDFRTMQSILEAKHPSLYWYCSKDSMDYYFAHGYAAIKDSMTEQQFIWQVLTPVIDKIRCGHTSVGSSKGYRYWAYGKQLPSFPLHLKLWGDSMAVSGNLNRKDTLFKRGTIVTAINGQSTRDLVNTIFNHLPQDGYADNINYIRLSSNFPYYHRNIYGLQKNYTVDYLDATGATHTAILPLWMPPVDTGSKPVSPVKRPAPPPIPKEKRLEKFRKLHIDSSGKYAILTLNTFSHGKLRNFFKQSFKELKQKNIQNLILDVRSNGGGKVILSTLLTKYLSHSRFKVLDSAYAIARGVGPYSKYIKGGFFNSIEMLVISRRHKDGKYHLGHLERKYYKPKRRNHYNGKLYVLINGPSFSATTLVANTLKGQNNVVIAGEEAGGGWHGNSGIMIPDIKLPHSKVTVRLPLFRVVQYNHVPKNGMGVPPDWYIGTSLPALIRGTDYKMQTLVQQILKEQATD